MEPSPAVRSVSRYCQTVQTITENSLHVLPVVFRSQLTVLLQFLTQFLFYTHFSTIVMPPGPVSCIGGTKYPHCTVSSKYIRLILHSSHGLYLTDNRSLTTQTSELHFSPPVIDSQTWKISLTCMNVIHIQLHARYLPAFISDMQH